MVSGHAGRLAVLIVSMVVGWSSLDAQVPKPFLVPTTQPPPPAPPGRPAPTTPTPATAPRPDVPTEAVLGAPVFPGSQYLTSYDAGRRQRFYLFGAAATFIDVVAFYRTALKQRGDVLFETPPTHQFETGRFREETMAFPPSVTIKDYTWGGSTGYPNPKPGAQPARYPTVIQFVPAPPGTPPG